MAEPVHPLDVGNTFDSLSELKQACATRATSDAFDQPLSFNFVEYFCNMEDESEPEDDDEVLEPPNTRRPAGSQKRRELEGSLKFQYVLSNVVAVRGKGIQRGAVVLRFSFFRCQFLVNGGWCW